MPKLNPLPADFDLSQHVPIRCRLCDHETGALSTDPSGKSENFIVCGCCELPEWTEGLPRCRVWCRTAPQPWSA